MNIFTNSALTLRRRSVWEAVDGGALLWRKNFVYFIPFFAVPVWVIACALRFLPPDFLFISYIGLWWLKPFFDRLLLHVLSVNFFSPGAGGVHRPRQPESLQGSAAGAGGEARFGSAAGTGSPKNLRNGLFKNLCKGLLGDLFWRRFSPARSARMPLRVLEGLGGKQYSQRKKTLSKGGLGFGRFLSLLGLAAEVMLLLGEVVFVLFIIQMFFPSAFPNIMDNFESLELFIFIAFSLNFILAESLYVCMGFGLYVNSRVEMEGWDLQILFQKFSEKARHRNVQAVKTILVVCFFLAFLASPLSRALPAEEAQGADIENSFVFFPDGFPEPGGDCLEKLSEILLSEDFG
ncbi:MAG: hypothetical protein FWH35_05505, partial [Treponema sp.]|nr:hypothetical protein [Treponema sp.]